MSRNGAASVAPVARSRISMRPPFSTMKRRPTSPGGAVAKTGSANPAATRVAAIALVVACGPFGSKP